MELVFNAHKHVFCELMNCSDDSEDALLLLEIEQLPFNPVEFVKCEPYGIPYAWLALASAASFFLDVQEIQPGPLTMMSLLLVDPQTEGRHQRRFRKLCRVFCDFYSSRGYLPNNRTYEYITSPLGIFCSYTTLVDIISPQ